MARNPSSFSRHKGHRGAPVSAAVAIAGPIGHPFLRTKFQFEEYTWCFDHPKLLNQRITRNQGGCEAADATSPSCDEVGIPARQSQARAPPPTIKAADTPHETRRYPWTLPEDNTTVLLDFNSGGKLPHVDLSLYALKLLSGLALGVNGVCCGSV
jgi:hypothetical protein